MKFDAIYKAYLLPSLIKEGNEFRLRKKGVVAP